MKRQATDWRKYFQITYLAKVSYPEFIKNSENSTLIIIFRVPDNIFKKLSILLTYNTVILLLPGIYPNEMKTDVHTKTIHDRS